jgi:hypothetical protein
MPDTILFEFNTHNILYKDTLIPQKDEPEYSELIDNISFSNLECGCCWSVYLPIIYEYTYREWLETHKLAPTTVTYINSLHVETRNWLYLDGEQKKFTELLNELVISEHDTTDLLDRDWVVKYHITDKPLKLFSFNKDIHRVSDIYKKILELYISSIDMYKDFIAQFSNWGVSNNLVYAKKLQMPKQMALNHGLKKLIMFDIHLNGKKELECVVY